LVKIEKTEKLVNLDGLVKIKEINKIHPDSESSQVGGRATCRWGNKAESSHLGTRPDHFYSVSKKLGIPIAEDFRRMKQPVFPAAADAGPEQSEVG